MFQSEDHGFVPVFKVHNLSKPTANRDFPCMRSVKLSLQKPSALAVSENCKYMAIGFDRGVIALYRGDISRNRSITAQTMNCGTSTIVGMAFRLVNNTMEMYVCSDSGVFMYQLSDKAKDTPLVLDQVIAPTRCCLLQSPQYGISGEGYFMVGRDEVSTILVMLLFIFHTMKWVFVYHICCILSKIAIFVCFFVSLHYN